MAVTRQRHRSAESSAKEAGADFSASAPLRQRAQLFLDITILINTGKFLDAIALCDNVIKSAPHFSFVHACRALALACTGEFEGASETMHHAFVLKVQNQVSRFSDVPDMGLDEFAFDKISGDICALTKEYDKAIEHYDRAISDARVIIGGDFDDDFIKTTAVELLLIEKSIIQCHNKLMAENDKITLARLASLLDDERKRLEFRTAVLDKFVSLGGDLSNLHSIGGGNAVPLTSHTKKPDLAAARLRAVYQELKAVNLDDPALSEDERINWARAVQSAHAGLTRRRDLGIQFDQTLVRRASALVKREQRRPKPS